MKKGDTVSNLLTTLNSITKQERVLLKEIKERISSLYQEQKTIQKRIVGSGKSQEQFKELIDKSIVTLHMNFNLLYKKIRELRVSFSEDKNITKKLFHNLNKQYSTAKLLCLHNALKQTNIKEQTERVSLRILEALSTLEQCKIQKNLPSLEHYLILLEQLFMKKRRALNLQLEALSMLKNEREEKTNRALLLTSNVLAFYTKRTVSLEEFNELLKKNLETQKIVKKYLKNSFFSKKNSISGEVLRKDVEKLAKKKDVVEYLRRIQPLGKHFNKGARMYYTEALDYYKT